MPRARDTRLIRTRSPEAQEVSRVCGKCPGGRFSIVAGGCRIAQLALVALATVSDNGVAALPGLAGRWAMHITRDHAASVARVYITRAAR